MSSISNAHWNAGANICSENNPLESYIYNKNSFLLIKFYLAAQVRQRGKYFPNLLS